MYKFINYLLFCFLVFVLSACTIKVSDSDKDDGGGGIITSPPPPPTCIYPNFNDTGVALTPQLSWMCNSYSGSGTLMFDVYLDTIDPPSLIAHDLTYTNYFVYTLLLSNKMYYWQVKSKNEYGSSSSGVVFFTTTAMVPDAGSVFKK
ncbi:MAG: hypothetical protein K8I03_02410 [Ignavibacteria bacterium]|nr:hypothetical protein [Ignavibacteria bacterium]